MPKPKTDPFRITAVLALLYMVLRVFFGITQLAFNKIGGQLDLLSPAQIWLYYILPDFFAAVVIGVPLSIGLFARKRPLILGGLAASAGITLLLNLISIGMSFRFNANTAYRFFSTLSLVAWGVVVLLLVFHLFKRTELPEAPLADASAVPALTIDLLQITAVLTVAYSMLRMIAGIFYIVYRVKNNSDGAWNGISILSDCILPFFFQPIAAGVLVSIGLFLKKRPLILGGLAVPVALSCLKSIASLLSLLSSLLLTGENGSSVYFMKNLSALSSNLASAVWAAFVFLLVFGLFKMISAQSTPQPYAHSTNPASEQNMQEPPIEEGAAASGSTQPESAPVDPSGADAE